MEAQTEAKRRRHKILVMAIIVAGALSVLYYFHAVLQKSSIVTQVFYIPIILACIWWRRKGVLVAVFLGVILMASHAFFLSGVSFLEDSVRAVLCIFIGLLVSTLRERTASKSDELARSERKFRELADFLPQVVWEMDNRGRMTYVNRNAFDLFGYTEDDFNKGLNVLQMLVPEERDRAEKNIHSILTGGETEDNREYRAQKKNGSTFPIEIYSNPIIRDNKPVGLRGLIVDITERKRAEERIKHVSLVLRAIRNVNQLITKEKDRDRLIKGACENLIETRGYYNAWIALFDDSGKYLTSAEEGLGKDFSHMIEMMKGGKITTCGKKALKQSNVVIIENPADACTGCPRSKKYAGKGGMAIRLEHEGKVYGLLAVSIPIELIQDEEEHRLFREVAIDVAFALHSIELEKGRKRAEEKLRESNGIINKSPAVVFLWKNARGWPVEYVSENVKALFGYSAEEFMTGKVPYTETIYPEDLDRVGEEVSAYSGEKRRKTFTQEYRIVTKDGKVKWTDDRTWIRRNERGEITHYQGIVLNITERKRAEELIKAKSQFLERLIHQSPLPTFVLDSEGICVMLNDAFLKLFSVPDKDLVLKKNALKEPANVKQGVVKYMKEAFSGKIVEVPEIEFASPFSDKPVFLASKLFPIFDPNDDLTNIVVVHEDITERKQAEETLRESDERYRALFDRSLDCVFLHDFEGRFSDANPAAFNLLGYERDEISSLTFTDLLPPDEVQRALRITKEIKEFGHQKELAEFRLKRKDGTFVDVEIKSSLIFREGQPYAIQGIARDITQRKRAEEKIEASLQEKEMLLREIHHRVKNNLQVISSLINFQTADIRDKRDLAIFRELQNRIRSMSLVHEKLYQSKDLAHVNFKDYIQDLLKALYRAYGVDKKEITLKIVVKDVSLGIDVAIPCGLIINELVSNALKHAFPEGQEGKIKISLHPINKSEVELIVSDNGIGLPEGFDFRKTEFLGLHIVTILVEDQLHGKVEVDRTEGTTFKIRLKVDES